MPKKALSYYLL
ncbi:hypothetical protein VTH06DRAFT_6319 [Thermothelomyces fergusii]